MSLDDPDCTVKFLPGDAHGICPGISCLHDRARKTKLLAWSKWHYACDDVGRQSDVVQRGYGVGWDRKKRGRARGYYYHSIRIGDQVRKIYLGKSTAAEEAAAAVARRRSQRHKGELALRTEAESIAEADRSAAELREWAEAIAAAWLVATGHHLHHGCWRYRRMGKRAPRVGSRAWDAARLQDPVFIAFWTDTLTKEAVRGSAGAKENLEDWLSQHPEQRPVVPQMRDLMEKVESIWIRMVAGPDKAAEQGTTEEIAKLKTELFDEFGGGGGILEKVLASSVAVNYLMQQHAAARLADKTDHLPLAAYREHRLTAVEKRLQGTLKLWKLLKEKKANGMSPPASAGFAVETEEQTAAPKPEAEEESHRPSPEPSRRPRSPSQKQPNS